MTRTEMKCRMTMLTTAVAGTLLLAVGCEPDRSAMNEFFPQENRAANAFVAAQAQAGAREDATLQSMHFDGAELNSLGRDKLDLMSEGYDGRSNVTIYLNFRETDGLEARREAVLAQLREHGVEEANVKFVSGPNPAVTSPAAGHMARLERTEGEATSTSSGSGESTPGFKPDPMTK